ncbi:hypothetical protein EKK58_11355 [Candidatus Dependentiae bacterium]|nr:MAG: hypothetical protein EKK58_11355 [Candidatus Dependentiae bacterium]
MEENTVEFVKKVNGNVVHKQQIYLGSLDYNELLVINDSRVLILEQGSEWEICLSRQISKISLLKERITNLEKLISLYKKELIQSKEYNDNLLTYLKDKNLLK